MAETSRISGLSIDLSMDTAELSRSFTSIKDSFRDIKRSAQVNLNNIKFDDKSVDTYRKNVNELSKSFDNQKKNVDDLRKHYDKMAATHGETSKEAMSARIEYNKQADELNKLGHALDGATNELKELEEQQRIASSGWTKMGESADKFGQKLQTIGGGMKDVGKKMSMAITAPLVGFAGLAVKTGMDFDDAMSQVAAISGATEGDLEALRQKAKDMGATTKFSASEAAEGLNYMALSGWDTEDMLGGLDGVMNLAAASGEDLGTVSDIVTDALSAFGLEAKDSSQFADVLAATSANANTDVTGLGNAFKYVAPVAGALGFTVEDTAKAIGLMSDNGIKGEKAGTALRTMMTNLAKPTKAMQEEMDNLGISLTDTDGNMKTFDEIMNDMRGSFSGLTEEQQASAAATIFGKESMSGALAIINTTEESFDGLGDSISNSEGAAKTMAETMEDNLGGTWREIKSGIEGFAISIYESMLPALSKMSDKILEGIQWLNGLSPKVKTLGVIFGAVAAAIGPLLVVGGSFLMFLGGVFRAITPVTAAIAKAGSVTKWLALALKPLGAIFAALTGPIGITVGIVAALGVAFTVAYAKSETFRNIIQGLIQRFKEFIPTIVSFSQSIYTNFMNLVIPAVTAVKTFFLDMFAKIKQFWQSDGEQVIAAIINGVNIVKTIVSAVMPVITSIISVAFKLVLAVVTMVWTNIKGVISGALNVIMGLVKVFSGIFTGDFSKMWEGVKQIFSGAIQVVWNGFQLLFYGRIIKGVGSLVKIFASSIRSLWTTVVNFFKGMFTGAVTQVTSMFNRVISIGRSLNSGFNSIIRGMVNSVINFFRNMFTNITTTVGNIRSGVQNVFSAMRDFVVNSVSRLRDGALNGFTRLKDGAGNLMTRMKDNVAKQFTAMVDGAKQLPGKLGSAISNGASKAVDGVKSLGNKMTGKLGSVVNGVIGGLNSITGKIGISSTISKWNVPTFSTGTGQGSPSGKLTKNGKIAMDTLATVGDKGKGNGKGTRELVRYPNGKVGLYDNDATIFAPKGTTIFSNQETEAMLGQLPKFSEGTGLWGSIKQLAGKAVDYITNPKKIFDDLIALVGDSFGDMTGFAGNFIKGAWSMIKDGMFGWIKNKFSEASVGKSQKWMDYKMTTPYSPNAPVPGYPRSFNNGHHYGIDYGTPVGVNITSPMAGTVSRMSDRGGGNVARLDAAGKAAQYFMHMNSVKTGKVGIGDSVGKSGNTGEWTTGPHVHWQHEDPSASYVQNRNTKNPLSMIKGHLKGGQILSDGLFNLHKGEYVINPNEPTEAMKLLAIVGKKLAGKSKQTREVASVGNIGSENSVMHELLDATLKQNQILMKLLNKKTDIYMDEQKVGGIIDEHNAVNASLQMF